MDPQKLLKIRKQYKQLLATHQVNITHAEDLIDSVKSNIYYLAQILQISQKILLDQKVSQVYKINCLSFVRMLVQTSQCIPITIIQVYFVSLLQKISVAGAQASNYGYYQDMGYTQTQVMERYQKLSAQIIKIGSAVKPYRMYQFIQMSQPSNFAKSAEKIKSYESQNIIIDKNIADTYNQNFLMSSKKFQEQNTDGQEFIKYYIGKTINFIESGPQSIVNIKDGASSEKCNLRSMLKYGSYHINFDVLAFCVDILEHEKQVNHKINALHLLSQMVLWGDIQAILLINYSDLIQNLTQQIHYNKRSYSIFSEIPDQKEQKQKFLTNMLKCIEIWAHFTPYDNIMNKQSQNPSKIADIYERLKFKQNPSMIFPNNPLMKTIINQFNNNYKNNSQLNEKILQDMHYQSMSIHNKVSTSGYYRSDTVLYISLKEKNQTIILRLKIIDAIKPKQDKLSSSEQSKLQKQMLQLKKQGKKIQEHTETLVDNQTSLNPHNLAILQQSSQCVDMIATLYKKYKQYKKKNYQLVKFKQDVANTLQKLQEMKKKRSKQQQSFESFTPQNSIKIYFSQKVRTIKLNQGSLNSNILKSSMNSVLRSSHKLQKSISNTNHNHNNRQSLQQYQDKQVNADDLKLSESEIALKRKNNMSNDSSNLFNFSANQYNSISDGKHSLNKASVNQFGIISEYIDSQMLSFDTNNQKRAYNIASKQSFKIKSVSPHSRFHKKNRPKSNQSNLFKQAINQPVSRVNQQYFGNSQLQIKPMKSRTNSIKSNEDAFIMSAQDPNIQKKSKQSKQKNEIKYHKSDNFPKLYMNKVQSANSSNNRQTQLVAKSQLSKKHRIFSKQHSRCSRQSSKGSRRKIFNRQNSRTSFKQNQSSHFIISNTDVNTSKVRTTNNENQNNQNSTTNNNQYYNKPIQSIQQIKQSTIQAQNKLDQNQYPNVRTSFLPNTSQSGFSTPNKQFISYQNMEKQANWLIKYQPKLKKKLVKQRNRIIKNQDLQIGSIVHRQDDDVLVVSYYVTPIKDIQNFTGYLYNKRDGLQIAVQNNQYHNLSVNKQYRIDFITKMLNYKYKLPQIKFNYKTKQSPQSTTLKTILPIPSTRFLNFQQVQPSKLQQIFANTQVNSTDNNPKMNKYPRLCTQVIPLQASILKNQISLLFDYLKLDKFQQLKNGTQFYAAKCLLHQKQFYLKIVLKPNQLVCFEGQAYTEQSHQILLHVLCEIAKLFQGEVQ